MIHKTLNLKLSESASPLLEIIPFQNEKLAKGASSESEGVGWTLHRLKRKKGVFFYFKVRLCNPRIRPPQISINMQDMNLAFAHVRNRNSLCQRKLIHIFSTSVRKMYITK